MLEGDIGGDDNRAALVAPSAFTRRGVRREITLCAEVATSHEYLAKHSAVDQREDCGDGAGETELI
jgi:hypothetical protein